MGLDIALGVMVALGAIRGWFRGFMLQAIHLGGLVGCVYAATPIRDEAKPYVVPYLTNVPPVMLDRMLWWLSAVIAAFLVGALDKYALSWVKQVSWASDLTKASTTLTWNDQYHPSDKIWEAAPVQHYVAYIQKMGVAGPSGSGSDASETPEARTVQTTASRPPRLDLPAQDPLDPNSSDFAAKFDDEFRKANRP
jgi:hypothetical protein